MAGTTDGVHWQRLILGVGLAAAAYAVVLEPVTASFRRMEASWSREVRIEREIQSLQRRNQALLARVRQGELALKAKAHAVHALVLEVRTAQAKAKALSLQVEAVSAPSVSLPGTVSTPRVQSTTGASGLP